MHNILDNLFNLIFKNKNNRFCQKRNQMPRVYNINVTQDINIISKLLFVINITHNYLLYSLLAI